MSTTLQFNFATRPLVPLAHDYPHGATEPWHSHDCAQLLHTLSGVVRIETEQGYWVVPPSRGVWLPAGTRHRLQVTGQVAARTLFIDPFARAANADRAGDRPANLVAGQWPQRQSGAGFIGIRRDG